MCFMATSVGFSTGLVDDHQDPVIDAFGAQVKTGTYYYIVAEYTDAGCPNDVYNGIQIHHGILLSRPDNSRRTSWFGAGSGPGDTHTFWYFDNRCNCQPVGQNLGNAYEIRNWYGDHLRYSGKANGGDSLPIVPNTDGDYIQWNLIRGGTDSLSDSYGNVQYYQFNNWNVAITLDGATCNCIASSSTAFSGVNRFCFVPLARAANGLPYIPDGKTILGSFGNPKGPWAYFPNCAGQPIGWRAD